jgi:MYXO-CTERM domain-containing protein
MASGTGGTGSGTAGATGAGTAGAPGTGTAGAAGSTSTGVAGSPSGEAGSGGIYPTGADGGAGAHGDLSYLTGEADYKGKVIVENGCGCDVGPASSGPGAFLLIGALVALKRRRRRR